MSFRRAFLLAAVGCACLFVRAAPAGAQALMQALPPTDVPARVRPNPVAGASGPIADFRPHGIPSYFDAASYETSGDPYDGRTVDVGVQLRPPAHSREPWTWQMLPDGLLYRAYLAGGRESRFASQWMHERDKGWLWDIALGGRVGMLRYGTPDPIWPEGYQLDIEGAAFPRLTLGSVRDLTSVDFRFGLPLTFRRGPVETKFAYYHLSSHIGDEYMVTHATFDRTNYSRDVLVAGLALRPHRDLRLYAEAGWAFYIDGGSQPWEFQFGIDYSPVQRWCVLGTPFFAAGARIREEVDFGGNMTAQTGLQWRGQSGQLFRVGLHYFNGKSDQYQFFREHEEQVGLGMWYDY
jgi:hypothetical protein